MRSHVLFDLSSRTSVLKAGELREDASVDMTERGGPEAGDVTPAG
jgi:hypothetical protein